MRRSRGRLTLGVHKILFLEFSPIKASPIEIPKAVPTPIGFIHISTQLRPIDLPAWEVVVSTGSLENDQYCPTGQFPESARLYESATFFANVNQGWSEL